MMLTSDFIKIYLSSGTSFCGKPDPFREISTITDIETRLHALTLSAILDIFSKTSQISVLVKAKEHWLLRSSEVAYKRSQEVENGLNQVGIGGPKHNARVWWQICRGIQGRFKGSLMAMLEANQFDSHQIYNYLQESKTTFPVLSGPVVSVRWLDLVSRFGGMPLQGWETLQVPFHGEMKAKAVFLDAELDSVHPVVLAALELWDAHCEGKPASQCGWAGCPRR